MQDFEMDFEWPVAKYEIQQPAPLPMGMMAGALPQAFSPTSLISKGAPRMVRPTASTLNKATDLLALALPTSKYTS